MKRSTKRTTALLGALVAGALCIGGTATAFAAERAESTNITTPLGQMSPKEEGYSSTLVVVTESGAESITVDRSETTLSSVLKSRGYEAELFRTDKGQPIEAGQRLANGEKSVVYSSTVSGTSSTIALTLPDVKIDDPNLYEGQTEVEFEGKAGSALKTTVIHRDLSKMSLSPDQLPETLAPEVLSSSSTQTGEEIYITVLEAPEPKRYRAGTKPCGSEYLCNYLKNGGLEELKISGEYVHPLGGARDWTTYSSSSSHRGGAVDFPAAAGTPIYAVADGVVVDAGVLGDGGNMVTIRHSDGKLTGYAHMVEKPAVEKGAEIKAGQVIGFVGSTGKSTGNHLHFEVRTDRLWGTSFPAYEYMRLHGVELGKCVEGPCELSKKE